MDGLLIDSESLVYAGVMAAARQFECVVPMEVYVQAIGRSEAAYIELLREHFGPDFPMDRFLEVEREEIARLFAEGVPLKQGALELLDEVTATGLPCALATSSRRESAERHLGQHGIRGRFHVIVAREDVTEHKPHPAPYLEAARQLGVDPAACLALEDSHNGVRAAHAAGMMTVMIPDILEATEEMRGLCVHVLDTLDAARLLLRPGPAG
jgi:HAD superfamily hydrolase (TIGR01509 family)